MNSPESKKYRYVFTIFRSFTDEYSSKHKVSHLSSFTPDELERFLFEISKAWSFQQEETQAGRVHYQGRMSLIQKKTKKQLLHAFVTYIDGVLLNGDPGKHHILSLVTVASEQDEVASFKYTKKDDSRIPGTFRSYPRIYSGKDLEMMDSSVPKYNWQAQLDYLLATIESSDRQVIVIYDPKGGRGKSKWCKRRLFYHEDSMLLAVENSAQQSLAALSTSPAKSLYLLDVPRAKRSKESWSEIFRLCETLKNGLLTSTFYGKYSCSMFDTCTVVLMTNYPIYEDPELFEQLSHDRWLCFSIDSSWDRRDNSIELIEKTYLTQKSEGAIINLVPPVVQPVHKKNKDSVMKEGPREGS